MKKGLVSGVLLILGIFFLSGCQGEDAMSKPYISVYGQGSVKSVPDTVEITITVSTEALDASAQTKNAGKTEKIIEFLKEIGLEEKEIKTIGANFYPNVRWENGKEVNRGYIAKNSLQVETKKLELISKIIDGSVANGAESIGGLTFTLSDEKKETLLTELIDSAVKDGKTQAEATVASLGQSLGAVKTVMVAKEYSPPYYKEMEKYATGMRDEMESTPVLLGELDYSVNVSVEFFIK